MSEIIFKLIEKVLRIDKSELIQIIKESFFIFLIACISGFLVNMYHPKGYSFVSASILSSKQIVMINVDEAKIKKNSSSVVFIDSRDSNEYKEVRIQGAIHIPGSPESLSFKKIKENKDVIKSNELVLYCDGASCGSSEILAKRLIDIGYSKHIYIIDMGLPGWVEKGLPLEKEKSEE